MARPMYEELEEIVCGELNTTVKKGKLSRESLDDARKMIGILNDISTIKAMENRGYSERGYYGNGNSYNGYEYRGSFDGRRGRDGDNDGRYSERGYYGNNGYNDGYSGHYGSTAEHLDEMMRDARTEQEREQIMRWKREMQG